MSTRVLTAHIPKELAEKVDVYAATMERPRAWIVKQALADWVAWEEEKHRRTLAGLADIEAGRTISHEKMVAWANSLDTDNPLPPPTPDDD